MFFSLVNMKDPIANVLDINLQYNNYVWLILNKVYF